MSAIQTLRDALFGNPPSPTWKPSREGVLAAITELNVTVAAIIADGGDPTEALALIQEAIDQTNAAADAALAAASEAEAWAQSPITPDPSDPSSKSAKTWAGLAQAAASFFTDKLKSILSPIAGLFQLTDAAGYRYFIVTPDQIRHKVLDALAANVAQLLAATGSFRALASPIPTFQATDANGYRWLKVTPNEFRHPVIDALASGRTDAPVLAALADIIHFLIYGQSLALGLYSTPVLSTVAQPHALRASGGVRPDNWTSLVDLLESVQASNGETVATACAMMIRQLVLADTGVDLATLSRRQLYSAAGKYDTTLADLSAGTVPFGQLTALMTSGRTASNAANKSYAPQMMFFLQGERDYYAGTARAEYLSLMKGLRSSAEAAARTASGIADLKLPMLTYQTATHLFYGRTYPGIALAQIDACDDALIGFAAPTYFLPFITNDLHLAAAGEQWLGAYFGLSVYQWLIKGIKPAPFVPDRIKVVGSTVLFTFPVAPGRKLVADTTTVAAQTNLGFQIFAADGSPITINAARIIDERTVALDCAATPAAGAKLTYGFAGSATSGRGNLRDNMGDTLKFDPTGFNRPLHTWAPIFEMEIF